MLNLKLYDGLSHLPACPGPSLQAFLARQTITATNMMPEKKESGMAHCTLGQVELSSPIIITAADV